MKKAHLDQLSTVTIPISMILKATRNKLGSATAFVYDKNDKHYLITNWHCMTGINPITKEPISNHAGIPDELNILLRVREDNGLRWKSFNINLYKEDKAIWLVHPIYKEKVDVVAIEIQMDVKTEVILKPINSIVFDTLKMDVADDIFILGYPFELKGIGQLPIWKKGSIATEPDLDYEELPKILVDTASRPGMSGSPVIFRRTGIHNLSKGGGLTTNTIIGQIQGFVGIYSGRLRGDSPIDAQLGIVWKKQVIDEIIEGNVGSVN